MFWGVCIAQEAFMLSHSDISQVVNLGYANLEDSAFMKGSKKSKKVFMISDFNNMSDFDIDITLLAREFMTQMLQSKQFALSGALASNAFDADPSLDRIRALRNNKEFADMIPKGALIAPKYALSARISNDISTQGKFNIITYHFIFSVINLENGLVEWDYIEHIKKSSKEPLPPLNRESPYGRACVANALSPNERKEACEVAINEIWLGNFESIPQNKRELLHTYAQKATDLGSAFGARVLGTSYKFAYTDFTRAKKYYAKSCEGGDGGGCYNLSLLYENAQGVEQDIALAKKYAQSACEKGFRAGCENLKLLAQYKDDEQLDETALTNQRDCEKGLGIACGNLSSYYYHGFGGANKNITKARMLLEKGCTLKDTYSCYQLGLWELQGLGGALKSGKKALEHIVYACETDAKKACRVMENFSEQQQYFYKCEDNAKNIANAACLNAGDLYENALDIKHDNAQALKYYKKSCDGGLKVACNAYNALAQKLK